MACLEFVDKYTEEEQQNKREEVLNDAIVCLKLQEERRTQDLYDFIDDFVTSQEYIDYVSDKRKISKRCAATQYDPNDITVEWKNEEAVEKYPLTEEQKKMHAFKRQFEKYEERRRMDFEVRKQERGIHAIRAKIQEARRIFECTWELRQKEKEKTDQHLMQKYSRKFGIDLKLLSQNIQLKLLERFKKCHHVLVARKQKRDENIYKIIKKLVDEKKMKTYQVKNQTTENIIINLEVVGTKIELIDPDILTEPEKPVVEKIAEDDVSPKTEVKATKKRRENKEKQRKKGKSERKKIKARREKPQNKLQLPIFPVSNPRSKILPENIFGILDLVEEFREFDNVMEDKDIMCHVRANYVPGDAGIEIKPDLLLFQNFDADKSYHKTVTIANVSPQTRKVRFLKFMFADQYDEAVFEVETFGIRKLFTGCKIKFYVNFQPYDQFKQYDGKLAFLSYDVRLCQYYQFEVPIRCVPKYSDLRICPDVVNFGNIPIWRAKSLKQFKVIKLQNKGAKACTIYIKKQSDPLDVEGILNDENKENVAPIAANSASSHQVAIGDILDECLKNVDNNFQFEDSFFPLEAYEEKRIKVFFKNASYIGNYFEQYTADVYEGVERQERDAAGCQMISLHAETIGHFLTIVPEILDFGTCSINSCYQTSFELSNASASSQAVSVRVPSYLTDFVQCDVSMVYMSPGGNRTVFVRLEPRDTLTRNFYPYYDRSSSILEFPIHLHVVSRSTHDYPPIKLIVYAILANFEDLTISCSSTSNLSNFLSTLSMDMGDCSIYETVWTDIFLTNNTAVTQVCGFVDLPQAVTMMPNLGFCKLEPGRKKKFRLYLSPAINDFPSFSIGSLRNSAFFFKISVDTIVSLGKISKGINPKRLLSSLDTMEKQLTIQDNELFVSMVKLVAKMKEHFQSTIATESAMNKEINKEWSIIPVRGFSNEDSRQVSEISQANKPITSVDEVLDIQNFLITETNSRKDIWCKVNLKRPLLEFSHQAVKFPDTPCGSYSVMEVRLEALEREIERQCHKKKSHLLYEASFQILGDSEEILVEPSCGRLKNGEESK